MATANLNEILAQMGWAVLLPYADAAVVVRAGKLAGAGTPVPGRELGPFGLTGPDLVARSGLVATAERVPGRPTEVGSLAVGRERDSSWGSAGAHARGRFGCRIAKVGSVRR